MPANIRNYWTHKTKKRESYRATDITRNKNLNSNHNIRNKNKSHINYSTQTAENHKNMAENCASIWQCVQEDVQTARRYAVVTWPVTSSLRHRRDVIIMTTHRRATTAMPRRTLVRYTIITHTVNTYLAGRAREYIALVQDLYWVPFGWFLTIMKKQLSVFQNKKFFSVSFIKKQLCF